MYLFLISGNKKVNLHQFIYVWLEKANKNNFHLLVEHFLVEIDGTKFYCNKSKIAVVRKNNFANSCSDLQGFTCGYSIKDYISDAFLQIIVARY